MSMEWSLPLELQPQMQKQIWEKTLDHPKEITLSKIHTFKISWPFQIHWVIELFIDFCMIIQYNFMKQIAAYEPALMTMPFSA